jgi:hypothetical protein
MATFPQIIFMAHFWANLYIIAERLISEVPLLQMKELKE